MKGNLEENNYSFNNNNYSLTCDSLIIHTTEAGLKLYESSKLTIDENSKLIDENILLIKRIESYLAYTEKINFDVINLQVFKDWIIFLNTHCVFLNFNCDLSINLRELFLSKTRIEQISYIRHIYVELHRHIDRMDIDSRLISDLCTTYGILKEFNIYNKSKKDFNTHYRDGIRKSRNTIFAHFDKCKDYSEYFNKVQVFDAEEVGKMCIHFMNSQSLLSELFLLLCKLQCDKIAKIDYELRDHCFEQSKMTLVKLEKIKDQLSSEEYNEMKTILNNIYSKVKTK